MTIAIRNLALTTLVIVSAASGVEAQAVAELARSIGQAESLARSTDTADREAALILAWQLEDELDRVPGKETRRKLLERLHEVMVTADPLRESTLEHANLDVAALTELAARYGRKRWWAIAVDLLDEAAALDEAAVAEPLAEALGERDERSHKAPPSLPDRLRQVHATHVRGDWSFAADQVLSPPLEKATVYAVCDQPSHRDDEVSVEIAIDADEGAGGLMFGSKSDTDYYLVEIYHRGGAPSSSVRVHRFDGHRLQTFGSADFESTREQRAAGIRVGVRVLDDSVEAVVEGEVLLRVDCPTRPHGGVGFFVTGDSPCREPIAFRSLTIAPSPLVQPGRTFSMDAARRTVARAEAAGGEDAVRSLRMLQQSLPSFDPADRVVLMDLMQPVLERKDTMERAFRRARAAMAERRVKRAAAYHAAGYDRIAAELVRQATAFDPEIGGKAIAKLELVSTAAATEAGPALAPVDAADVEWMRKWFVTVDELMGPTGCWSIESDRIVARGLVTTDAVMRSHASLAPNTRVVAHCDIVAGVSSCGIAFHAEQVDGHIVAVVDSESTGTRLRLLRCDPDGYRPLTPDVQLPALPPGRQRVVMNAEFRTDELGNHTISFGIDESLRLRTLLTKAPTRLGIFAATSSSQPLDVVFRGLRVDKL